MLKTSALAPCGKPMLIWPSQTSARRHGFSEASYCLWRSKFGGMSVPDAKRLKDLEAENTRLKKLLAEQVFQNDLIKDALQKQW